MTSKYFAIRSAISDYVELPDMFVDLEVKRKMSFGIANLKVSMDFFQFIKMPAVKVVKTTEGPRSFELLNARNGLVYYTYKIDSKGGLGILSAKIQDRAYVYVDEASIERNFFCRS